MLRRDFFEPILKRVLQEPKRQLEGEQAVSELHSPKISQEEKENNTQIFISLSNELR